MKQAFLSVIFLMIMFGSCRTPKDISYFQGIENLTPEQREAMNQKYIPRICIDDQLIIYVTSPDRETVAPFATPPFGYYAPGESEIGISATTQNLFTYLVDENGDINFPVLGHVRVAGQSINETIRMMEGMIREYAPLAVVNVQIANFKVGIFGEVKTANVYTIKTPRVSILDLVAMAGDLTIMGDRKNVWLHRDNNGEKVQVKMDLTDPALFASPYYYLQQNDMVYVMPNDAQKRNSKFSNNDNVKISMFSVIISSISLIATSILTLRNQNLNN
ncbi:MAG: polysaccharide biosynthesis/export family protein [Tannerella sp.]|jgi:polysaccharide export outer membrane protein|nr:polysaccharide biosynthesis/export family protein [Tannerella sp.]